MPPQVPTLATRVCDFMLMNPPEFHTSKTGEDLTNFIEEAYWVLVMGILLEEKTELVSY